MLHADNCQDAKKSLEDIKTAVLSKNTKKAQDKSRRKEEKSKKGGFFSGFSGIIRSRLRSAFRSKHLSEAQTPAEILQPAMPPKPCEMTPGPPNSRATEKEDKPKIFKTGIKGFDQLFRKGIPYGSTVLVEGGPGSGKTNLCLQIAYNSCKNGLKTLYMSFEEPESKLKEHMANFGLDYPQYEEMGLLRIKRFNALDISRSVEALLSEAKRELLIDVQPVLIPVDFKPDVVCIDSISSIASAFSGEESRFRVYMEQFFRYLEKHEITSFLIRETSVPSHIGEVYSEKGEAISFLSDGIIVIYNVIYSDGRRGRALEVLKMRGEDINRKIVEVEIVNSEGFVVYPGRSFELKQDYKLT